MDPLLQRAIAAQLDEGTSHADVASWLEALAPDLGWDETAVEAFAAGRGVDTAAAEAKAAHALARADLDEALITLRQQAVSLANLFLVQRYEIHRAKVATHDKTVKAHVSTAEQFRKHVETLRDALPPDPSGEVATVGGLLAKLFDAAKRGP